MSIDIDPADSVEQANRENQYYLYEPILLSRHLRARPKKEAYLYFPKKDDQIIENPKKPEKTLRMNIIPGDNNVFPPVMPSDNFSKEGDNLLISEEDYKSKCNGKDKPSVICEEFIEKWEREKIEKEEEEERKRISMMNNTKPKIDLKRRKSNKENLVVQKEQYESKYVLICRRKTKGKKKVSSLLGIKSLNYNTPDMHYSKFDRDREIDSAKTGIAIQKTNT